MDILGKAYNNALKTFNSHTAREPFNLNNIAHMSSNMFLHTCHLIIIILHLIRLQL